MLLAVALQHQVLGPREPQILFLQAELLADVHQSGSALRLDDGRRTTRGHTWARSTAKPAQPRKGFFEYCDFVKVRDQLGRALRNIAEFEDVTGWIDTEVLPRLWRQVDFAAGEVRIDDPRSIENEQARVFP